MLPGRESMPKNCLRSRSGLLLATRLEWSSSRIGWTAWVTAKAVRRARTIRLMMTVVCLCRGVGPEGQVGHMMGDGGYQSTNGMSEMTRFVLMRTASGNEGSKAGFQENEPKL